MSFFGEVRKEVSKVEWPTGKQLSKDTGTVISTITIFAIFFFAVDWVIQRLLGLIIRKK